jgi:hypothetical protein
MQQLPRDTTLNTASAASAEGVEAMPSCVDLSAERPSSVAAPAFDVEPVVGTEAPSVQTSAAISLSDLVSSIALLCLDTRALKAAIKMFNVQGLANAPGQAKTTAVATRMPQYGFSVTDLRDAIEAKELIDDGGEVDLLADMTDEDLERCNRQKCLLARLSDLPRISASYRKASSGACEVLWGKGAGAPRLTQVVNGSKVLTMVSRYDEDADADGDDVRGTRSPIFSASEYARLLHVLVDARMTSARRLLSRPRDRDELDREPVNPWDVHMAPLFNDSRFAPVACKALCDGITAADVFGVDPSKLVHQRTSSQLSEKWAKLQSEYTKILDSFQRSGQHECDVFPRFAHGKGVIMYLHNLARTPSGSVLLSMATQLIEQEAREEAGLAVAGTSSSSVPDRRKSRKRQRDINGIPALSVQRQSELRVTGLEALSVRPDPDSEFQARHLAMAEASKGHAESVTAILQAIRDVTAMLNALVDNGGKDGEIERAAYLELKKDLLCQLADVRDKEKRRQQGLTRQNSDAGSE